MGGASASGMEGPQLLDGGTGDICQQNPFEPLDWRACAWQITGGEFEIDVASALGCPTAPFSTPGVQIFYEIDTSLSVDVLNAQGQTITGFQWACDTLPMTLCNPLEIDADALIDRFFDQPADIRISGSRNGAAFSFITDLPVWGEAATVTALAPQPLDPLIVGCVQDWGEPFTPNCWSLQNRCDDGEPGACAALDTADDGAECRRQGYGPACNRLFEACNNGDMIACQLYDLAIIGGPTATPTPDAEICYDDGTEVWRLLPYNHNSPRIDLSQRHHAMNQSFLSRAFTGIYSAGRAMTIEMPAQLHQYIPQWVGNRYSTASGWPQERTWSQVVQYMEDDFAHIYPNRPGEQPREIPQNCRERYRAALQNEVRTLVCDALDGLLNSALALDMWQMYVVREAFDWLVAGYAPPLPFSSDATLIAMPEPCTDPQLNAYARDNLPVR